MSIQTDVQIGSGIFSIVGVVGAWFAGRRKERKDANAAAESIKVQQAQIDLASEQHEDQRLLDLVKEMRSLVDQARSEAESARSDADKARAATAGAWEAHTQVQTLLSQALAEKAEAQRVADELRAQVNRQSQEINDLRRELESYKCMANYATSGRAQS